MNLRTISVVRTLQLDPTGENKTNDKVRCALLMAKLLHGIYELNHSNVDSVLDLCPSVLSLCPSKLKLGNSIALVERLKGCEGWKE